MKEADIRPADLFAEYLRLSALDAERLFDPDKRRHVPCPGCNGDNGEPSFTKNGFEYALCANCGTLFQSPRPQSREFGEFYRKSKSSDFWAEKFLPVVIEARREKIFRPRIQRIKELCESRGLKPAKVVDVGAGHGIALEEWRHLDPEAELIAVEPGAPLAEICRQKGFTVVESLVEEVEADTSVTGDLVTCFEVIEHVADTRRFARSLYHLTAPGGVTLVSGLGVEGFDIQVLWERSNSVSPPHHINFLSVAGFKRLFEDAGFSDVGVFTPGQLDVDILVNAVARGEAPELHRFFSLMLSRGEECQQELQKLLARHQLSSHCWIMGHRKA